MAIFNKEAYWKNRRDGKRGQGPIALTHHTTKGPTSLKSAFTNRFTWRLKTRDHTKTQKTARIRSKEEAAQRVARIKRTEAGEQERVAVKARKRAVTFNVS